MLIRGAHAGYIDWEEYEQNQRRLREQLPGLWRRPAQESAARRARAAAGTADLRPLRQADDGALSQPPADS